MFGRNSMRFQPSGPTVGGSLVPVKFNGFNGQPVQRSYADGGKVEIPKVPQYAPSLDEYYAAMKQFEKEAEEGVLNRELSLIGGALDAPIEALKHLTVMKGVRRSLAPKLGDKRPDRSAMDKAVNYAGGYDWGIREGVDPLDAIPTGRAYQLRQYMNEPERREDAILDYLENTAGLRAAARDKALGVNPEGYPPIKEAINFSRYAGGGLASLDAKSIPRETLERLPFATLERMRRDPGVDQNFIAPLEHAAFTREFTKENPLLHGAAMALATPAYSALKGIGYYKARSDPSLEEVLAGYRGIGEGLSESFDEKIERLMAPLMPVPEAERQVRKKMAEGGAVNTEVEVPASSSAVRRFLDFPTTRMAQGGHVKKHKESGYYAVNNKYAEGGAIRRPSIPRELPGNIDEAVREMARLRRLGIAGAKGFTGLGEAPSVMRPEELEAYGTGETAGLAADVADLIPGVGTAKALAGAGLGALKGGLGLAGMIRQGGIPNINMFHNVEGGPRSLLEALEQTQRRGIGSFDNLSVGIGPNIYGYAEGPTLVMNPRSKEFDPATAARNQLFNRDAYTARLSRGSNLADDYRLTEGYTPEEAGQTAAILASPSFRSFKEYEESPYGVAVLSPFDEEAHRLSEGVTEDYNLWLDKQNMFGNLDPSSQMSELINAANKGDPEAIRLLELYRSMPSEYAELKIPGRTPISRENVSAILIPHFMDKNISPVDFIERLSDVTDVEFGTPYAFATKDMREQLHDLESNTAKEIADIVRSSTSHKDIMENLSPEARKYFSSSFSRQLYDDPSGIPELTKEMFRASPEFASDVASDITRREFLK